MRLQEASISELEVSFKRAHRLAFGLRSQSKHNDCSNQDTNEAQSYRKLVEWVTRNES
jgi:hypothetical protein